MALQTENSIRKNRCRICLEATNGKITLDQTITYKNAEISLEELLNFCLNAQVFENGKADGLCLTCMEKGIACYEFKKMFEESQNILMRELQEDNRFEINREDLEEKEVVIKEENVIVKEEIFEEEEKYQLNECDVYTLQLQQESSSSLKQIDDDKTACIFRYKRNKLCYYCSYNPQSSAALRKHMRNVHKEITADGTQIPCPSCDKIFYNTTRLDVHMLVHTGIKKHMCEYCGMSFSLRSNMLRHMRIHTGEKPYTCSECGKGFTQLGTLKSHQTIHSDERNHVCQQCGAAFSTPISLYVHKKLHGSERPHKCTVCTKAFLSRTMLQRHIDTHNGVRKYACEFCGKRYSQNSRLVIHRKTHRSQKPNICKICGKGFMRPHGLKAHVINAHLQNKNDSM